MPAKTITGGEKEFVYSKEDIRRIEREDTESTEKFKKALDSWYEKNKTEKMWADAKRKALLQILTRAGIALLILAIALLLVRYVFFA